MKTVNSLKRTTPVCILLFLLSACGSADEPLRNFVPEKASISELEKMRVQTQGKLSAPGYSRRGHLLLVLAEKLQEKDCERAASVAMEALDAHLVATDMNPRLALSWRELLILYRLFDEERAVHGLMNRLNGRRLEDLEGHPGKPVGNTFFISAQHDWAGRFGDKFMDCLAVERRRRFGMTAAPAPDK